ncbi:MAG: protoheme IX farnesyltransferase [Ignavibacteria bacterium]
MTVLVAFTTTLGYVLDLDNLQAFSLYPIIGIFFLACGASALNHYQERRTDLLMDRTKNRPIPSGTVTPSAVLIIAASFLLLGSATLLIKSTVLTLGIGLLTFFWYNAVYTPMKKVFSLAIIPGSLVGALPPLAGWVAAGGDVFDPKIMLIATFFFIWQIPHFWILLLVYGKDYDKGGFPTLTNIFSSRQLINITFCWIILTIVIALSFNFFGIMNYNVTSIFLVLLCGWLLYHSLIFLRSGGDNKGFKNMFIRINIFALLIITSLSLDKLIKLFLE